MAKDNDDGIAAFMLGLLAGLAGGAVLGVLFAPKSGEEMREDLGDLTQNLPKKLNDEINNPQSKAREFIDRTRYNIESQVDKVKKDIEADRMARAKRAEETASGYEYN